MRLERVEFHNFGPFRQASLNLAELAGDVIALTGENGAGKSTFAEAAVIGACYRKCPTRGPLIALATARDSYIESTLVNGKKWTIRHSLDSVSRKSEALVLDAEGAPVLSDTKVSAFEEWAERTFPNQQVVLNSIFCAQKSSGFLGLKEGDRKGVFLRTVGIDGIELFAEAARKRRSASVSSFESACTRLADELARSGDVDQAKAELEAAREAAAVADQTLADLRAELENAKLQAAAAERAIDEHERAERERQAALAALEARAVDLRKAVWDAAERVANNRKVLADADKIRAAVQRIPELEALISQARVDQQRCAAELEAERKAQGENRTRAGQALARSRAANARADQARRRLVDRAAIEKAAAELPGLVEQLKVAVERDAAIAEGQLEHQRRASEAAAERRSAAENRKRALERAEAAEARAANARRRLVDQAAIERASAELPVLREQLESATRLVAEAEARLEELRGKSVAGAKERIAGLRGGLERIAGDADVAPGRVAQDTLAADDQAQRDAVELPGQVAAQQQALSAAKDREAVVRRQVTDAERLAARAPEMASAAAALEAALKDAEVARADASGPAEGADGGFVSIALIVAGLAAALERQRLEKAVADAERLAARAGDLELAATDLEAAQSDAAAATAEAEAEQKEIDRRALVIAALEDAWTRHGATIDASAVDLHPLPALAKLAGALEQATAKLAIREPELAKAQADLAEVELQISSTPGPGIPPPPAPSVAPFEAAALEAEAAARRASSAVAVADQKLSASVAGAQRVAELTAQRVTAETELADWTRLAEELGRDGLQAALIDAAVPELVTVCNSLLHSAFGNRFTLDVRTQRLDSKGKRELETLDVVVIDTVRGREADAETLSGGEGVVIAEAFALALTTIACRQSGIERPTCWRDESAAALDPRRAEQYVNMLRCAGRMINADRMIFVAHNERMHELADARIVIENGTIGVQ